MKHFTLVVLAALGAAGLIGCNSLTEPNQYNVVKERRDTAPAPPKPDPKQGSMVLNVGDDNAPNANAANAPKGQPQPGKPEAMKAVPAKAQPAPQPAAGSCGE